MPKTALSKIKELLKQPSFTAAEARAHGVSPSLLAYYVKKGEIQKLSRGVYCGNESTRKEVPLEWEDLIATARSIPNGRVCLISALALYELTEEIPRQFWIAIPNEQCAPKRPKAKIIRMRDVKTGSTRMKIGSVSVPIFDKERTLVDSFRFLASEIAIKALKEHLSGNHGKPDLVKLRKYARKLKTPIEKYVEAFTT
jgi:predicted transcriptional regulator of viral defense system